MSVSCHESKGYHGEWVKYEDHQAIVTQKDKRIAELEKENERLYTYIEEILTP